MDCRKLRGARRERRRKESCPWPGQKGPFRDPGLRVVCMNAVRRKELGVCGMFTGGRREGLRSDETKWQVRADVNGRAFRLWSLVSGPLKFWFFPKTAIPSFWFLSFSFLFISLVSPSLTISSFVFGQPPFRPNPFRQPEACALRSSLLSYPSICRRLFRRIQTFPSFIRFCHSSLLYVPCSSHLASRPP